MKENKKKLSYIYILLKFISTHLKNPVRKA